MFDCHIPCSNEIVGSCPSLSALFPLHTLSKGALFVLVIATVLWRYGDLFNRVHQSRTGGRLLEHWKPKKVKDLFCWSLELHLLSLFDLLLYPCLPTSPVNGQNDKRHFTPKPAIAPFPRNRESDSEKMDNKPLDARPLGHLTADLDPDETKSNGSEKKEESPPNEGSTWKGNMSNNSSSLAEQPLSGLGDAVTEKTSSPPVSTVPEAAADAAVAAVAAASGGAEQSAFLTSANTTRGGASRRGSSLELRKMPVNVLLRPEGKLFDEELSLDDEGDNDDVNTKRNLLQRTCLNSKFTLRSQMMLSFGTISAGTILLVVLVCIAISILSGEVVKEKTRETFDDVANLLEARATRYIAEDLTPRLLMEEVVDVILETTKDRFYGYPVDDDSKVPFFDTVSQSNKYPIKGKPLPLDWQIEGNVNEENYKEHMQERWHLYAEGSVVSTANGAYYQQGMCDPSETDPTKMTYMEGCTDANNNITTGGIHAPSPTNEQIYRKSADLIPILKALYEYHQDVKAISIIFSNSGAGSSLVYPATQLDSTSEYTSIGCDWLKAPHPLDPSRTIMSQEEIERCSNEGMRTYNAKIPTRLYSPLDRGWCRDQVLNPGKKLIEGPYPDAWAKGQWLMSVGEAVFDPSTKEFIACTHMSIDAHGSFSSILSNSKVTGNSHVSVVRWDLGGRVVSSTAWDMLTATGSVTISDLNVGVTKDAHAKFYKLVDYTTAWDPSEVHRIYEEFVLDDGEFQVKGYPIPPVPNVYDEAYEPRFLVLFSASVADVFSFAERVSTLR